MGDPEKTAKALLLLARRLVRDLKQSSTALAEYTKLADDLAIASNNTDVTVNGKPLSEYNAQQRRDCEALTNYLVRIEFLLDTIEQSPDDAEERIRGLFPDSFPSDD